MHSSINTGNTPANVATRFAGSENVSRFREGKVYAVLFSDGWLKVGRGRDPKTRITSHAGASSMRNAHLVRSAESGVLANSGAAENQLIAFCESRGEPVHGREWFVGVEFDDVCQFINDNFKGDCPEYLAEARESKSRRVESMLNQVFGSGQECPQDPEKTASDQAKWFESIAYARILDRMYRDDMYSGWLFQVSASGLTNFCNYAALTTNTLDEGEIADLFYRAATNPSEALDQIVSTARALIDAYAAEVNQ
ncbi:hypothetical protein BK655_12390 [Pseudomonas brassicacearum]|uniref:hypothetical protein n=1 Tax=Pseudomonas brassicacearum TaxID=930166 RepID=UPI000F4A3042|nr:hypothetical protein [Pseudomonas brassicacearum]ROM84142.1 hypothetical protein BK655_12390 [Pseudomonas brassicacearum]